MFALIIGIDIYASEDIPSLSGAVADARALKAYLMDRLDTPEDHITMLENASATRAALIEGLQRLAMDPRIRPGEPILVFYAGYGSQAVLSAGCQPGDEDTHVQVILPSDALCKSEGKVIAPIPNCALDVLLEGIAQKKGDNIILILDSGHSVSERMTTNQSSELVRSVQLPPNFRFQENLEQVVRPTFCGQRSHVLLSACSTSGQAWEYDGRGVFTVAVLDLLCRTSISKLRYCDIIMRLDIDLKYRQSPRSEGCNQDKCIFTLTSLPSASEIFVPARTRVERNGPLEYVLSGGAAHGLVVGDEFDIYPDMDYPHSDGTLAIVKLDSFYSILRPVSRIVPITRNSIATRAKAGKRQSLRIYSHPEDQVFQTLSVLQAKNQDLSNIVIVSSSDDAQIDISTQQDNLAVIQLTNIMGVNVDLRIETTVEELEQLLKASSRFFFKLGLTAANSSLSDHVQIEIHKLIDSPLHFPAAPVGEHLSECEPFVMEQDSSYGLKITNKSAYDLFPIVQVFYPNRDFQHVTLYRHGYSQSGLDSPLQAGQTLTLAYGSGGSCLPLTPFMDGKRFAFLKVSLFTRPLDPLYDAQSFRSAHHLPKDLKGLWTTITKLLIHNHSWSEHIPLERRESQVHLRLALHSQNSSCSNQMQMYPLGFESLSRNSESQKAVMVPDGEETGAVSSVIGLNTPYRPPIEAPLPPSRSNFKLKVRKPDSSWWPKLLWRRIKQVFLQFDSSERSNS